MADAKETHTSMEALNLNDNYLLVAAIDFGTTFSGYAFSFKASPTMITMNKNWGSAAGIQSLKAPTCVLTNPDGTFNSFGFEAEDEYLQHEPDEGYQLYRGFKMVLHKEDLSMDCAVDSVSGHSAKALDIFAMSMRFLKDHLMDLITKAVKQSVQPDEIRWVLTVPAIWTDKAKQFMRLAACQAGLITEPSSDALLIALEPEAASFYCRTLHLNAFTGADSDPADAKFKTGDKMLIIDAGGGTVDITAHELQITGEVKEIAKPSGGPWGGLGVNRKFSTALSKIFGQDFINHMRAICPQQWVSFASHFEKAKKSVIADGEKMLRMPVVLAFASEYKKLKGTEFVDAIKNCAEKDVMFASGFLAFKHNLVKSFFEESCKKTVKHVKKLLKNPDLEGLRYILLVGGYGDSPVLQDACTNAFGRICKVLVPLGAQTAIIQGAVLFGHQPTLISSRLATATYGCEAAMPFDEYLHDPAKKFISKRDGQLRCHGTFRQFVKTGEQLKNPEVKSFMVHPKSKEEKVMIITILKTEKESVLYCDDEGVSRVGQIRLKSARKGYLGEDIEIRVTFGHTEILVEARDTAKGDNIAVKTSLDF